jgi:hypothetical protein
MLMKMQNAGAREEEYNHENAVQKENYKHDTAVRP